MYRRHILVTGFAIAGALAGCAGDGDTGDNGTAAQAGSNGEGAQAASDEKTDQTGDTTDELTGVETYSGEWSGSIGGESYSGVWQFEANFDDGQVEGWFEGDGSGDITGTVSGGKIDAQGGAAFGTVEWSGEFSSDGQEISGTWELAENLPGSGTWSGSVGELERQKEEKMTETEEEEDALPEEDKVSGDEPLERYPDSVILSYAQVTGKEGTKTEIEYGSYDSLDEVQEWYKEKFGDPRREKQEGEEISLLYRFGENEIAEITISKEQDHTEIHLVHVVQNG